MNVTSTTLGVAPLTSEATRSTDRIVSEPWEDDQHSEGPARPSIRERLREAYIGVLAIAEDSIHYGVALVLIAVAALVLYRTAYELATSHEQLAQAATTSLNGLLFAIIIMEVMRTVMAHFDRGGLQLQPFLTIGIVSAVREILSVGARLSLQSPGQDGGSSMVHLALLELAVNGGLVVGLAVALMLVRCLAPPRSNRLSRQRPAA
jgi:uncharacterized membrane protein (DUF373 family)